MTPLIDVIITSCSAHALIDHWYTRLLLVILRYQDISCGYKLCVMCENLVWTSAWARRNSVTCSSRQMDWRGSTTVMGKCLTHDCRVSKSSLKIYVMILCPTVSAFLLWPNKRVTQRIFAELYSTAEGVCNSVIRRKKKNTKVKWWKNKLQKHLFKNNWIISAASRR